ncbi:hypothetical protein AB835_10810 [Candidatus Endobugula sertula]|uniref:Uncharacterized protein n=1 Tax=Candidatus Endobugula sertula TaxID=62101 RepID=A0A1D2QNC9_9GAMM|nr:hypothetical protein AB835_10810 [Candidatus Endobugula sertula]
MFTLATNTGFGPDFTLTLKFTPLSTRGDNNGVYGLGRGWQFQLSQYLAAEKSLALSSGATYVVTNDYYDSWELSHKVKDIEVVYSKDNESIYIYHKDGTTEELSIDIGTNNAYLFRLVTPSGRAIYFEYIQKEIYMLEKVFDQEGNLLLSIDYGFPSQEVLTISVNPDSLESRKTTLNVSAGVLMSITQADDSQISFDYMADTSSDLLFLQKIIYPSGASESIEYDNIISLPAGATLPPLLAISRHTKTISNNQPQIVTDFKEQKIDDNNYWGNNVNVDWADPNDNLAEYSGTYEYTSETTCGDKTIYYRYNKFHQPIEKKEENASGYLKITTYQYFGDASQPQSDQESRYELAKSKSILFQSPEGRSQNFLETYEFDDWGNLIKKVDISGVATECVYFNEKGEDSCPANRFRAFIKSREIIPIDGVTGGEGNKKFAYTYYTIDKVDNSGTFIVPLTITYSDYTLLFSYYDKQSDEKVRSEVESKTVQQGEHSTSVSFTYTFNQNSFTKMTTVNSFDDLNASKSEEISMWFGNKLSETDVNGIKSTYTYNVLDLPISQTKAAGTDYEILTTYQYDNLTDLNVSEIPKGESTVGTRTTIASNGITQCIYYDGVQKAESCYQSDNNSILRKVSNCQYDNQERLLTKSSYDYELSEDSSTEPQSTYINSTQYQYGVWGEICQERYHDGTILLRELDPFILQMRTQTVRRDDVSSPAKNTALLPASIIKFDVFLNPTQQQQLTLAEAVYSETLFSYDGLGRKTSTTTPTKSTATIDAYDAFDRILQATNVNDEQYTAAYHPFSQSQYAITSLDILDTHETPYNLGMQMFNGLSQITQRSVAGRDTSFLYTKEYNQPDTILTPQHNEEEKPAINSMTGKPLV